MEGTTTALEPTTVALRFRDLDTLGHVNQSVYHEFLDEAEAAFLGGTDDGLSAGIVTRVELDHRSEVAYSREAWVVVETTAHEAPDGKSGTLSSNIVRSDGKLAAEAKTCFVRRRPGASSTADGASSTRAWDAIAAAKASGQHVNSAVVPQRIADATPMGWLSHTAHHMALEQSRATCLFELLEDFAARFVLAHVEIDYLRQITPIDGALTVETTVSHVGNSSVRFATTVSAGGHLSSESVAVLVAWDPEARGARTLTAGERERFAAPQR